MNTPHHIPIKPKYVDKALNTNNGATICLKTPAQSANIGFFIP